jgi:hypothetical protein
LRSSRFFIGLSFHFPLLNAGRMQQDVDAAALSPDFPHHLRNRPGIEQVDAGIVWA